MKASRPPAMDVSIVIVSYNVATVLEECLASIRKETTVPCEILVVDNASSDRSAAIVQERYPEATLIRNRVNAGFARANNQAIREARGRYLLLLNPDTLVLDGAVDRLVRFMDLHPDAGACGPRNLNPDGTLQHNCHCFPSLFLRLVEHLQLQRLYPHNRVCGREHLTYWDFESVRSVDWITGCSLMIRREALHSVGLLDENYFMYSEEMDFCYRLKKAGWKVLFNPDASIVHYGGQSALQQAQERVFARSIVTNLFQSRYYFFRKNYGPASYLGLRTMDLIYFAAVYLKNLARTDPEARSGKLTEYGTILRFIASPKMPLGRMPLGGRDSPPP